MIRKEKESVTETEGLGFSWSGVTSVETDTMTQQGKAKIFVPVNETWNIGAETCIQIKTNQTTRILIGITLLFVFGSSLLVWRIQALELKNDKLQQQIMDIQLLIPEIVENYKKQEKFLENLESNDAVKSEERFLKGNRVSGINEDVEHLRYRRQVSTNNDTNVTELENEVWPTNFSASPIRSKERGNMRRRMTMIREKDDIAIAKLKLKLKNARIKTKEFLARQSSLRCDARAAYLVVNGPEIDISQRGLEHIGPWYMANNGSEYGFRDKWYQGLSLDSNGTSVIFSENGLHLIYAQIYYTLRDESQSETKPLGYRIFIKKYGNGTKRSSRPYQIAECVSSYPSTTIQTCFTQVAWYVESGDQIYLQHFTSSLPLIEAEKVGQTFLGIVKLSGSG